MRIRRQDSNRDMTFGQSAACFYVDSVEGVAQLVRDRLGLWTGEWFVDVLEGTPYLQKILAQGSVEEARLAIIERIQDTEGVLEIDIDDFDASVEDRELLVTGSINTQFGSVAL